MANLKEIVEIRLEQLGLGAVEAATAAGIERTYIRDIVERKKKSVRADKLAALASALKIDAAALARGELVPVNADTPELPISDPSEIEAFLKRIEGLDEYNRRVALNIILNAIKAKAYEQEHSRTDDQSETANPHREPTP